MTDLIRALAAAALFSTGGAVIKGTLLPALAVAGIRSGIAAAVLILLVRRRVAWTAATLGIAAAYSATLLLFVAATKLTTAAGAIFLQSTAPLYVAMLAPITLGETFRARDLVSLSAVAIGLGLCLAGNTTATDIASHPFAGNLLGAACGLTWALTLLGLRWAARRAHDAAMSAVIGGNLIACLVGLPSVAMSPWPSVGEWVALSYLGVFQIAVAYVLLTTAARHLPALQVSLLLLLEPVLNPIWTWVIHGERPGVWTLAGGTIIVAASVFRAVLDARTWITEPSNAEAS